MDKVGKEAKEPKTPTTQDLSLSSPPATGNPDWPGFKAYSPMHPHGYMASPQAPHPYMWGVQPVLSPYGTPPHPYMAMYPHGGIYAHPSMPPGSYPFSPFAMPSPNGVAEASGNQPSSMEAEGKVPEGKEKLPIKRSKGSLGSLNINAGKNNEGSKASGASANGGHSKSVDTQSEGTSEGSDANSENGSLMKSGCRQDSLEADASQNGGSSHGPRNDGRSTPSTVMNQALGAVPIPVTGIPGPTTNLNIGMDYWGGTAPAVHPVVRGKVSPAPVVGGLVTAASGESLHSQLWMQDERELKRQRRKQSNRESARRSRLRKQTECDELAQRAEVLKDENSNLRSELNRIRTEYEQLLAQNASLKERLGEVPGQEDLRSERKD